MVFSSIIFLFLFLPVVLGIYHILFLPVTLGFGQKFWRRASNLFLLFASLLFYFWGEQFLVWIVVASTFIDYICGLLISGGLYRRKIEKLSPTAVRTFRQKLGLVISICSNLAFLGFFKYFNFGIDNYNNLMAEMGLSSLMWKDVITVILPLGISFYTFQSMSYTIDVYRGNVTATRNLIDFSCYVTMFPQLVAGPIVRYRDIAGQLTRRFITRETFVSGVSRFIIGLGKKVIIANTVGITADKVFALSPSELTTGAAWLGCAAYTLQIYFDFSGYSDMAIGLGRMLGFEFRENFNYPYISRSVREFWQRWHISLSTWFRDYLYIPLGGSRCPGKRTYFNLIMVFFLCGLWHGASWTFVAWGLYHGLFLILERKWLGKFLSRQHNLFRHGYTLLVIMFGWVLFVSDTFSQAINFLAAMTGFDKATTDAHNISWYLSRDVRIALILGIIFSMPILGIFGNWQKRLMALWEIKSTLALEILFSVFRVTGLCAILIICMTLLSSGAHNPFLYFRF